jgi:hypothetical protein
MLLYTINERIVTAEKLTLYTKLVRLPSLRTMKILIFPDLICAFAVSYPYLDTRYFFRRA